MSDELKEIQLKRQDFQLHIRHSELQEKTANCGSGSLERGQRHFRNKQRHVLESD